MKNEQAAPAVIADFACHCGEGPMWHPDEKCLYWTDIPNSKIFKYDPQTGETETHDTGVPVGGFTVHEDGRLLFFTAGCAVKLWDRGRMETVIDAFPGEENNTFNDVIADPEGRVFCGAFGTKERPGRLYRLDPDGSISVMLEGRKVPNGMGFSPDLRTMYFCDSADRQIYAFDYDRSSGDITHQRIVATTEGTESVPDGMTVDAEGFIWSARWDGYCLVRMNPDGKAVHQVDFPTKKVSSVIFGGDDMTDIYVTTAGGNDTVENGEPAGALFHLNLGIRGKAEFRSRRIQCS
jgi:sugar lactone lactonase YvrE